MWKLSITNKDAKPASIEIGLMRARDAVDHAAKANGVVRPAPPLAGQREPCRYGPVDIGELIWFDITAGNTRAREEAKVRQDLLLGVEPNPAATGIAADGRAVGGVFHGCNPTGRPLVHRPLAAQP